MGDLLRTSLMVFVKDVRSEFRTRYVLNSLIMFVLVTITMIRFAVGDEKIDNGILTGLLWIAVFFAASGALSRTFVKEEEKETSVALKLSADPTGIFAGKLFFNLALSFCVMIMIVILFALIMDYQIKNMPGFVLIVILGNLGLVTASTIISAIISKANSKGTLYPVLSFPVLLPLLITVISATAFVADGADAGQLLSEIQILISYDAVITAVSFMLFRYIWED